MPTAARTAAKKLRTISLDAPVEMPPVMSVVRETPASEQGLATIQTATPKKVRINVPQARALAAEMWPEIDRRAKAQRTFQETSLEWYAARDLFRATDPLVIKINGLKTSLDMLRPVLLEINREATVRKAGPGSYDQVLSESLPGYADVLKKLDTREFERLYGNKLAIPSQEQIMNRILVTTIPLTSMTELHQFQEQIITDLVPGLKNTQVVIGEAA